MRQGLGLLRLWVFDLERPTGKSLMGRCDHHLIFKIGAEGVDVSRVLHDVRLFSRFYFVYRDEPFVITTNTQELLAIR